jgi:hypothetical protein
MAQWRKIQIFAAVRGIMCKGAQQAGSENNEANESLK